MYLLYFELKWDSGTAWGTNTEIYNKVYSTIDKAVEAVSTLDEDILKFVDDAYKLEQDKIDLRNDLAWPMSILGFTGDLENFTDLSCELITKRDWDLTIRIKYLEVI